MSQDSRDQFEQAYSEDNDSFPVELLTMTRMGDSYTSPRPARAWYWWKRARAGIVVDLPEHYQYDSPGDTIQVIKDCREAIEAAGLRTEQ